MGLKLGQVKYKLGQVGADAKPGRLPRGRFGTHLGSKWREKIPKLSQKGFRKQKCDIVKA